LFSGAGVTAWWVRSQFSHTELVYSVGWVLEREPLVTVGASEALVALTAVTKHLGELSELDTSQEKSPTGLIFS